MSTIHLTDECHFGAFAWGCGKILWEEPSAAVHGLSRVKGRVLVRAGFTNDSPTVLAWCSQPQLLPQKHPGPSDRASLEMSDSQCNHQDLGDKCKVQAMEPACFCGTVRDSGGRILTQLDL